MANIRLSKRKLFTTSRNNPITPALVAEAINLHKTNLLGKYKENENIYMSDHGILHQAPKEAFKPDNRLVINYAKYIVDTFGGYHMGIPVKVSHEDNKVDDFIADFRRRNDMEDSEYEVAKLVDIFGHAFIYLYQDEAADTRMTYDTPINMIMVHDDSIQERPYFAIRYSHDEKTNFSSGEVITEDEVIPLAKNLSTNDVRFLEPTPHHFAGLPIIEVIENDERQGLFDAVKTLIHGLNKAVSEKANDVDYFADAYLKIIGVELDEEVTHAIRDSRILNLFGEAGVTVDAGFLDKPNADTTQENLIRLLTDSIFTISMVANLSDENFGQSSGTALAFKLQPMSNMALAKDRKIQSAFNRMYQQVFSIPLSGIPEDAWKEIKYQFTRNMPRNLKEEAEVAKLLDGQVSDETKLSTLSVVDNAKDELEKVKKEKESGSQLERQIEVNKRLTDADLLGDNGVIADGGK